MRFCFVSTRRGSHFMTELLSAISAAMAADGHTVELVFDEFPPLGDECVYVVIPHEFDAWGDPSGFPDARQCARTIALCTENPGTEWFEATYQLVPQFAAAVAINRSSAAELQRRGIRCEHLQLGYSPLWDSWLGDEGARRDIDVLYLGAADPRRDPLLAGIGRELWARECQFLIPPLEPRTRPRPDFLKGAEKYHRLRSAKILLNLHRTTSSALEWMRFLEAICNGCVVVSEPCLDSDPLVAGRALHGGERREGRTRRRPPPRRPRPAAAHAKASLRLRAREAADGARWETAGRARRGAARAPARHKRPAVSGRRAAVACASCPIAS